MTDGNQVRREHALEWIAAGLVALLIFSGILFYKPLWPQSFYTLVSLNT